MKYPSPKNEVSTPSSENRKKSLGKKIRKAKIISWNHIGKWYVIKRDDGSRQTFKCISEVMKLPHSDVQKIMSLGIDRYNESESANRLIEALKLKGFSRYEKKKVVDDDPIEIISIVSWELLSKMMKFLITYQNGVQEYLSADRIVTRVLTDLQALIGFPLKNESNDKFGDFMIDLIHRKLEDVSSEGSSRKDEDEEEEQFFGNEDEPDNSEKDDDPVETKVPLAQSKEYLDGNFVMKRENGSSETFNSDNLLCMDERSLLNLADISMVNQEKNDKANNIEQTIKAFSKSYVKVNG
ncbi:hypothetical protein L1987_15184 [Smallanthus sonchifolius]|uniref:Uncharacterized protein n=1 Tax=Smallanthus sonchifolius TaxID=185202 RepID=A0ACB9J4X8_9ASTR|nr:hypothetical protein L1987_15184 [Smallanthus sonchifolius]